MEKQIKQVGSLAHQVKSTRDNPQRYRVYLVCGLAPTLNTCGGGGLQPYIVERCYETVHNSCKQREKS